MNHKFIRYINHILDFIKLYIAKIISLFYPQEKIWLISERGHEARDNGCVFFIYLKNNHPEIKCKYVLDFNFQDFNKMMQYRSDLIQYRSWSHYIMLWRASHLISTHYPGWCPNPIFDGRFDVFKHKKRIFLQHGIIKDDIPYLYGSSIHVDLFVSGAQPEYEYLCANFNHPQGVIQYTGLCRYDNLNNYKTKRQILIMPTWRKYIDKSAFEESEYYQQYKSLLTSEKFAKLLESYDYTVIFYPHFEIQSNIDSFKKLELPKSIKIAGFDYDVQTLLKESDALITDYSSVYFDMGYMHKPIVFFQFDQEQFYSHHYFKGYVQSEDIGYVVTDLNSLEKVFECILANNCKMEEKYEKYISSFFPKRDDKNCDRVFDAIYRLK